MPEPHARVGALDQPRQVGEHEAPVAGHGHDSQDRHLRREGVIGDLGTGAGEPGNERALAGVRLADQADVGDHLELEEQPTHLPLLAGRGLPRRAVGRRLEVDVAPAAGAPLGGDDRFACRGQVLEHEPRRLVDHDRARRHEEREILRAAALAVRRTAGGAVLGPPLAAMGEGGQRIDTRPGLEDHAAAVAAVTAVGAALRHIFLAPKAAHAAAAIAGGHLDLNTIHKHAGTSRAGPAPASG